MVRGAKAVDIFRKVSRKIQEAVIHRNDTSLEKNDHQDHMYQNMGITTLLKHGELVKERFDRLGEALASMSGSVFLSSQLKSFERALPKTQVSYCGDCTQLRDVAASRTYRTSLSIQAGYPILR